jgi:hypothetical protein
LGSLISQERLNGLITFSIGDMFENIDVNVIINYFAIFEENTSYEFLNKKNFFDAS